MFIFEKRFFLKATLLITTYNWSEALQLVLLSAKNLSVQPYEIIIADDGSKDQTKLLIEKFIKNSNLSIRHIWHEDKGFRRSAILNKAIAQAEGDYIIQLDGDCIMHKDFVKDHITASRENTYLFGSRVTIKKEMLPGIFESQKIRFGFFDKGISKRTRNLRIPLFSKWYASKPQISKKMRGCNLSYWKKDFINVNGYNEDIEGWGREDSELILRMLHSGVLGKRLRYAGIIYHIWHRVLPKDKLDRNNELQEKTMLEKIKRCTNGIDKYL